MRATQIISRISELETEIETCQREIDNIRDNICKHKDVTKTHGSNTGNYDPSSDRYWTEFNCLICGKFWTEEGSK